MLSTHNRVSIDKSAADCIDITNSRGSPEWKLEGSSSPKSSQKRISFIKGEKLSKHAKRQHHYKKHEKSGFYDYSKHGVEIKPAEGIVFRNWEPGYEYTKNLVVKNVTCKTLKFCFTSSMSVTFQYIYPQPVFLSPGTSFTMPITFRPVLKKVHEDKIEFYTEDNSTRFVVPVKGVITLPVINLPPEWLKFDLCAVDDISCIYFPIENHSEDKAAFTWRVPPPFTITPSSGEIAAHSVAKFRACFQPTEGKSYEGTAVCNFNVFDKKLVLYGIGKYSQILVENWNKSCESETAEKEASPVPTMVEFSNVAVHSKKENYLKLTNCSHVKCYFSVRKRAAKPSSDQTSSSITPSAISPFFCSITSGEIEAKKSFKLPIIYNPTEVNSTSIDYFEIVTSGTGAKSIVKAIGNCTGPMLSLSTEMLDFGHTALKVGKSQVLTIVNDSDCQAAFQLPLDIDKGIFRVEPNTGVIAPHKFLQLKFTFVPLETINYYRRVPVNVHEMGPVMVDLIGTCHNELVKPPVIQPHHIYRDRIHQSRGLTFMPPDVLHNQYKLNKLLKDDEGCLSIAGDQPDDDKIPHKYNTSFDEYFDDGHHTIITHRPPHVSIDKNEVWFGEATVDSSQPSKHVTLKLTNHTRGKINVVWIDDKKKAFSVTPAKCEIPPRKSSDFRLFFNPKLANKFYSDEMECYVSYSCMRDYRLVNDEFYVMPWFVSIHATGHTFDRNNEAFRPTLKKIPKTLAFPPVVCGGVSYKTLLLEQKDEGGQLPLMFQLDGDETLERFCMKPKFGVITSRRQIITLRYSPKQVECIEEKLKLRVNDDQRHDKTIHLFGSMEKPEMMLTNQAELYFRQTHLRTESKCSYEMKNVGRSRVKFRWIVSSEDVKFVSVNPVCGVVQPNEIASQEWTFRPQHAVKRLHRAYLLTWIYDPFCDDQYDPSLARRYKLRIIGEGVEGEIKVREKTVDFGSVVVGSNKSDFVLLYNESHCDLRFKLSVEQTINKDYDQSTNRREPLSLQLSDWTGVVNSRGKFDLMVHAAPHRRVLYAWSIYCEILDGNGNSINPNSRFLLTELSAEGVFPTAGIIDVRSLKSGANISKTQIWRWLNIDHFNLCLDTDPQQSEVLYSATTRLSISRRPSLLSDSVLDFNFGAAPVGVENTEIEIVLKNLGFVTLNWNFLMPKDIQITLDYWADSGQFSTTELHELYVQDNKLFEITPGKGELKPNEIVTISMKYKHHVAGTHRLPVLFKIDQGKEVMLNFVGVTVEMERRYLHYVSTKHTFTPVPIGSDNALVQLYEMFNGGSTPIIYEVGLDSVQDLQQDNFDRPILTCLNPRGEIPPCSTSSLRWIFNPIESRSYTIDIPIHILGGDTAVITFIGIGYDSRKLKPSMLMTDQASDFTPLPIPQQIPVKGQCLQFSEERISFGNVPLYSRSRHLLFITNKSQDRSITYSWHAANDIVNQVLSVSPVRGTLDPGESIVTKIIFCATGRPSFYDLDLVCEIIDEYEQAEYESELETWHLEMQRMKQEFTISDGGKLTKYKDHPLKGLRRQNTIPELKKRLQHPNLEKRKYSTLPAINYDAPVQLPPNNTNQDVTELPTDQWPRPEPPRPTLQHLGITARTHEILEYRTYFGDKNDKQFIDRTLQIRNPVKAAVEDEKQIGDKKMEHCSDAEMDGLLTILSGLLRNILDDPTVIEGLKQTANEPIPLFNNFRTTIPKAHCNRQFTQDGKLKEEHRLLEPIRELTPSPDPKDSINHSVESSQNDSHSQARTSSNSDKVATYENLNSKRRESKVEKKDKTKMSSKKNQGKASIKSNKKESKTTDEVSMESSNRTEESSETKYSQEENEKLSEFHEPPSTKLMNQLLKNDSSDQHSSSHARAVSSGKKDSVSSGKSPSDEQTSDIKPKGSDGHIVDFIKRMPELGSSIEDIFANTLENIIEEALYGEVLLTARPRIVALPPSTPREQTRISVSSPRKEAASSSVDHK